MMEYRSEHRCNMSTWEPRLTTYRNLRPKIQLTEEKKVERPDDEFKYLFYLYYFRTSLVFHLVKTYAN
jgi:hypothetical protein